MRRKEFENFADQITGFKMSTTSFPGIICITYDAEKTNGFCTLSVTESHILPAKERIVTEDEWSSLVSIIKKHGVFDWKKSYPSDCLNGLECELDIALPNGSVHSEFHNKFPNGFDEFVNDLESLFGAEHRKFKYKLNE